MYPMNVTGGGTNKKICSLRSHNCFIYPHSQNSGTTCYCDVQFSTIPSNYMIPLNDLAVPNRRTGYVSCVVIGQKVVVFCGLCNTPYFPVSYELRHIDAVDVKITVSNAVNRIVWENLQNGSFKSEVYKINAPSCASGKVFVCSPAFDIVGVTKSQTTHKNFPSSLSSIRSRFAF